MSPFLKAMQHYRRYRPYSSTPLCWFDDRLWSECLLMVGK